MFENKKTTSTAQKEAQKRYDTKTEMISIKYSPVDMPDYDRMMQYLKQTGQSRSGFIKSLINDFFEKRNINKLVPKEEEKAKYFKFYNIDSAYFEKLKKILGDDKKYNLVLDYYADCIEGELDIALEEKGIAFEKWVDELEENINDGEIEFDDNVKEKDFQFYIAKSMDKVIKQIIYG